MKHVGGKRRIIGSGRHAYLLLKADNEDEFKEFRYGSYLRAIHDPMPHTIPAAIHVGKIVYVMGRVDQIQNMDIGLNPKQTNVIYCGGILLIFNTFFY